MNGRERSRLMQFVQDMYHLLFNALVIQNILAGVEKHYMQQPGVQ